MNKIIFLDIDGVLNVIPQGRDEYGAIFHKHFEDNLRWIIEQTGAKIVISSTWRFSGLKVMQEMWKKRNLPGEIIDITPNEVEVVNKGKFDLDFYDDVKRGHEIQYWIDNNSDKIFSYYIIDDDNDMLFHQINNFVRTANNIDHSDCIDIGYGLTRECAQQVIEILNTKFESIDDQLRYEFYRLIASDWAKHEDDYPYVEQTVDDCIEIIKKYKPYL